MNTYVFWLFRGAGVVMADAPCMHQSYCAVLCKKVAMLWQDSALCEHSHSGRESVELCGGVLLKRVLEKKLQVSAGVVCARYATAKHRLWVYDFQAWGPLS